MSASRVAERAAAYALQAAMEPALATSFDLLATAPQGVAKLRELILSLAVRGKLVPQDPRDQPARGLLQEIRAEKGRLIAGGEIKRGKPLAAIVGEERPFELPHGWEWTRFGDASINRDGERIPVSLSDRENRTKTYDYYGASGVIDKIDGFLFDKTLLLIGEDGANLVNRSTPIAFLAHGKYWVNNHAHVIDTTHSELMTYLALFINAISLEPYVTGTAQPKMNQAKLNSIVIALPPLAEQARIVARVEELMQLCDALEAHGRLQDEQHARLVATLFDTLAASESAEALAENWQRLAAHFDLLLDRPEAIDALEQTILQLAVRGLLVPEDPADESVGVLVQKINAEKVRGFASGKIKGIVRSSLQSESGPFAVPESWVWLRLGDAVLKVTDGTHHSPTNVASGPFKYISAKNIKPWGVDLSTVTFVTKEVHEEIYARCNPEFGDVLYIKDGATTGVVTINTLREEFSMLSSVALIKPSCGIRSDYLVRVMASPYFYNAMRAGMTGVAITRVTLAKLNDALIPLPPLAEQHRIVARVEQLRGLCAELRERLQQSRATQSRLAEALAIQVAGS